MQIVKQIRKQSWIVLLLIVLSATLILSDPISVNAAGYATFDNPANRGESVGIRRSTYYINVEIAWVEQGDEAYNTAIEKGYNIPTIPATEEFYFFQVAYRVYDTTLDSYPASNDDINVYLGPDTPYDSETLLNVSEFNYNHAITPDSGWVFEWKGVVAPKGIDPYLVYKSPVDEFPLVWQIKSGYPPLVIDDITVVEGGDSLIAGRPNTITTSVSGGSNQWPNQIYYQYHVIAYGYEQIAYTGKFDNSVTFNVDPHDTGERYDVYVDVFNGDEVVSEFRTLYVRDPDPLNIAVFRSGWSDTYELGQTVDLAARGEEGYPPYKYQFYVLRSNGSRVNFRKDPVSSNIYPWTPVTPDTYTLGVDVYDAMGNKVTQERTITVKAPPPFSIAVFRAGWSDTYELGQTIDLAARGEGGTAPYKYQFYVLRSNGSRVNFRKTPVSSNIYPWTPVTPDTYTLGVDVYDATGRKVTEEKTITVLAGDPLRIAVFRAGWSDTYELGQKIDLAARGEGGTAPYKYQFYVLRSNGNRVNFRKDPVSSNIYPWTPVTPDTYTLGVDVYDATGKKVTEEKTITVLPGQ